MKKYLLFLVMGLLAATGAKAQKNIVQYQQTQAYIADGEPKVYMRPLSVELKVTKTDRQTVLVKIPVVKAFGAMNGDPNNWRSYAIYEATRQLNCDVVVAPLLNVSYDTMDDDKFVHVEVIGFPANFTNWKTLSQDEVIFTGDRPLTTADFQTAGAVVRK